MRIALAVAALLSVTAFCADSALAIREWTGQAGVYQVGTPVNRYPTLRRSGDGYRSPDGAFTIAVDRSGNIASITTTWRSAFTQSLISPGASTLGDVIRRYGKPAAIENDGRTMTLAYDGVRFAFDGSASKETGSDQTRRPVQAISVVPRVQAQQQFKALRR